jgi:hypothetical protein
VIKMRRLLIDGAKALQKSREPVAAQGGAIYRAQSHSTIIDETGDFDTYAEIMDAMALTPVASAAAE